MANQDVALVPVLGGRLLVPDSGVAPLESESGSTAGRQFGTVIALEPYVDNGFGSAPGFFVRVTEMMARSPGSLRAAALRAFHGAPVIDLQEGVAYVGVEDIAPERVVAPARVLGLVRAHADGTLQRFDFRVLPDRFAQAEVYAARAREYAEQIRDGEVHFGVAAGRHPLADGFSIELPDARWDLACEERASDVVCGLRDIPPLGTVDRGLLTLRFGDRRPIALPRPDDSVEAQHSWTGRDARGWMTRGRSRESIARFFVALSAGRVLEVSAYGSDDDTLDALIAVAGTIRRAEAAADEAR